MLPCQAVFKRHVLYWLFQILIRSQGFNLRCYCTKISHVNKSRPPRKLTRRFAMLLLPLADDNAAPAQLPGTGLNKKD